MEHFTEAKVLLNKATLARANYYAATEALEKVIGREVDDEELGMVIDCDFSGITQAGLTDNQAKSILGQI